MDDKALEVRNSLSKDDWTALADYIKAEQTRRAENRRDKEKICREVDRQIAMRPKTRRHNDATRPMWYPDIELPLQFNALEVIAADCRRLLFPRTGDWFKVRAEISDEYEARWHDRRLQRALIGKEPLPMQLDQETADVLIMSALKHYHQFYDFRGNFDALLCEGIKYGTMVGRIKAVRHAGFSKDYRGVRAESLKGPALIPCSFWNTYLDDSWNAMMHEGENLGPSTIRRFWQPLEDLKKVAASGQGGWIKQDVDSLIGKAGEDGHKGLVELLEFEGDLLVPREIRSIFLTNVIVTVAVGQKAGVVRFQENPMPFRSYVSDYYFKDAIRSPYGSSPLVKGKPLQELATEMANDWAAVARLNGLPPVVYDRNDPTLTAMGGPQIHPNALWPTDAPNAIEAIQIGDVSALMNGFFAAVKQYEDTTGVNDARRGARLKSHTTAEAANIEASQGISRTDDFVTGLETGILPTILHMEFEIIKAIARTPQPVSINSEGIEGWVQLAAQDLADLVEFEVVGSEGALEPRQKAQDWGAACTFAVQMATAAAQFGVPVPLNFQEMITEMYEYAGFNDTARVVGAVPAISGGAAAESAIPGIAGGGPELGGMPGAEMAGPAPGAIPGGPTIQ